MPEILPHPLRGTMEIGSERIIPIFGEIRAAAEASDDNPIVTIVATDGSEDRHGSVINPRGWDFEAYLRNPVVLWSHGVVAEYPPLARTVAIRSAGGKWEMDALFALGPWANMRDNMARFLWEWYRDFGGNLAASVGFMPKDWSDRQATTVPSFFAENVSYDRQEMTEWSFVNVPSNRNTISKAIERARAAGSFTDGMAKMLGFAISPIVIAPRAVEPQADKEALVVDRSAFRASVRDIMKRCCGCDSYYYEEPAEPVDEATRTAEIQVVNDLAADCLQDLETAMAGWKVCENEDLRSVCSSRVGYAMSLYDWLDWWLERTYGEELGASVPDINFTDVEQVAAAAPEAFTRAGAVLSTANLAKVRSLKDNLMQGVQHCDDLIAAASKSDSDSADATVQNTAPKAGIRVIVGDSSKRELGGTTPIRLKAPADASDGRAEGQSRSDARPDVYRVLLARK